MKKSYYHATSIKNLGSIMIDGIKTGFDGIVYLTKSKEDALKFLCIRCLEEIVVLEVNLPEKEVHETFDHSYSFFQCKAYGYPKDIPTYAIKGVTKYSINRKEN